VERHAAAVATSSAKSLVRLLQWALVLRRRVIMFYLTLVEKGEQRPLLLSALRRSRKLPGLV
jgi:hypothetical protein